MRDDELLLHRFLLGELAEDEAESLERRLLQEEELFDLCEAIEGDLLAASARGELTAEENERVLTRLAASSGGRDRLALAQSLVHVAEEPVFQHAPKTLPWRAGPWMAMAACLLLAVSGFWVVDRLLETMPPGAPVENSIQIGQTSDQPAEPSSEVAQQQDGPEKSPAEPSAPLEPAPRPERPPVPLSAPSLTTAVFQLGLATLRSDEKLPRFAVPKGTGEIEIQLDLEGEEQFFQTFSALVRNPGAGEVWSRQGLEPQTLDWTTALVLEIPAEKLPDGRYEMEVQGVTAEGQAEKIGVREFEIVAE